MKKFLAISLLAIAGFALMNMTCVVPPVDPVSGLNYEIVNDNDGNPGGAVKLTWTLPASSDDVVVSVDGVDLTPVVGSETIVYTAGGEINVYNRVGQDKSSAVSLDLSVVETPTLDVYSVDDPSPDDPSGFGFGSSGTAAAYAVSTQSNWPLIDFYIASGPKIASPSDHLPTPLNDEVNAAASETSTYDNLVIASPTGQNLYFTNLSLASNGVYSLWIDPTNNGYSADDNFAKAHVTGIDGYKVTFTFGFQTKAGLRWIAN